MTSIKIVLSEERKKRIKKASIESADFNTLYTQIISHINYNSDAASWGYSMTNMIKEQLELSVDPNYVTKFNALAEQYNKIK